MNFIKNHQRGIALAAAFAFFWLIQVGNLPLKAEMASSQQTGVSSEPEQPGTIEQVSTSGRHVAKKSPILPIIIGVVVVGAVAAVLILVVFKTKYDIRGTWSVTAIWEGYAPSTFSMVFSGERESGTFVEGTSSGTYTVDGKKVTWYYPFWDVTARGEFTGKDFLEGTLEDPYYDGTFTAVRIAEAAAVSALHPGPAGKTK